MLLPNARKLFLLITKISFRVCEGFCIKAKPENTSHPVDFNTGMTSPNSSHQPNPYTLLHIDEKKTIINSIKEAIGSEGFERTRIRRDAWFGGEMNEQSQDEKYMQMALKLAGKGVGEVEPNPAVGCVIVKDGQVIGRGWHKKFGQSHAEINAIEDCRSSGNNPAGATVYVTLEPCCHEGKTGACTKALIEAHVSKVVIAAGDPSEHLDGKGIEQLREAGIKAGVGVCEQEAKLLNAWFLKYARKQRPWVIVKWAQSIDGKLAWSNSEGERGWISNERSRKDVHKLRRSVQGILVGINTVLADDPLLTARPGRTSYPFQPARIVLDPEFVIPLDCKLVTTAKTSKLIIAVTEKAMKANAEKGKELLKEGVVVIAIPVKGEGYDLDALVEQLGKFEIARLLVEGGAETITSFLKAGVVDETRVYIAPKILGSKGDVGISEVMGKLAEAVQLYHVTVQKFDGDVCLNGFLREAHNF